MQYCGYEVSNLIFTRKCPLRGHILAPPEGLRAVEVPRVNPGSRPQESGGDSKAIYAKKNCDILTNNGRTDVTTEIVI